LVQYIAVRLHDGKNVLKYALGTNSGASTPSPQLRLKEDAKKRTIKESLRRSFKLNHCKIL